MKKLLLMVTGVIMLVIAPAASGQRITEGDKKLTFLAGETAFKIQYVYDDMMVGTMTEADYRKKRINELNAKEKGKGELWEINWVNSRTTKYEPMFEELMNKNLAKVDASASKNEANSKYTIVVRTILTEPGFNAIAIRKDPYVNFEISWIETATGKVMAKGTLHKVPGRQAFGGDFDFDPSNGIQESYAKAGKTVAKNMLKAIKAKK